MWCLCVCSGSLVAGSVCVRAGLHFVVYDILFVRKLSSGCCLCVCNRYTVLCVAACKCSPSRFGTCRVCSPSRFGGRPCVCSVCGFGVSVCLRSRPVRVRMYIITGILCNVKSGLLVIPSEKCRRSRYIVCLNAHYIRHY